MSFADIQQALQDCTRTIESLNSFEEWLDTRVQLAEKGVCPLLGNEELREVLERYKKARYVQTPAPTTRS